MTQLMCKYLYKLYQAKTKVTLVMNSGVSYTGLVSYMAAVEQDSEQGDYDRVDQMLVLNTNSATIYIDGNQVDAVSH